MSDIAMMHLPIYPKRESGSDGFAKLYEVVQEFSFAVIVISETKSTNPFHPLNPS
jgi:hypothetical protein